MFGQSIRTCAKRARSQRDVDIDLGRRVSEGWHLIYLESVKNQEAEGAAQPIDPDVVAERNRRFNREMDEHFERLRERSEAALMK